MNKQLDPRSALASEVFPAQWKRWANTGGKTASKRRQELRKAAEIEVNIMRPLRAKGASCATCAAYRSSDQRKPGQHHCATHSDFYGFIIVEASQLCHLWEGKSDND